MIGQKIGKNGRGDTNRTRNLLGWNQTLYQLSYTPSNYAGA